MRIIKLEPQDRETAIRSLHRDDNNRFNPDDEGWVVRTWVELTDNPDSYMLLMDNDDDGLPDRVDRATGARCSRGARFVVDTQRLWHVVVHHGTATALRADHERREHPGPRQVGRPPAPRPGHRLSCRPRISVDAGGRLRSG